MKRLLHFSAILLMCVCAMSSQAAPAANNMLVSNGAAEAIRLPMGSTSAFADMYGVQSFNNQSLSMYGAQSQVMHGSYTVPMAAQSIGGGTTTVDDEEEVTYSMMRRALGGGSGGYRPDYDQGDPFHTPLGEIPVLLLILAAAGVTYFRVRKLRQISALAPAEGK